MPLKPQPVLTPLQRRENMKMNMFYYDTDKQKQVMNVIEFLNEFVPKFTTLLWDRPNDKAPWHWQADLVGFHATLNVYPHKASWYIQFHQSRTYRGSGWEELEYTLKKVLAGRL